MVVSWVSEQLQCSVSPPAAFISDEMKWAESDYFKGHGEICWLISSPKLRSFLAESKEQRTPKCDAATRGFQKRQAVVLSEKDQRSAMRKFMSEILSTYLGLTLQRLHPEGAQR